MYYILILKYILMQLQIYLQLKVFQSIHKIIYIHNYHLQYMNIQQYNIMYTSILIYLKLNYNICYLDSFVHKMIHIFSFINHQLQLNLNMALSSKHRFHHQHIYNNYHQMLNRFKCNNHLYHNQLHKYKHIQHLMMLKQLMCIFNTFNLMDMSLCINIMFLHYQLK